MEQGRRRPLCSLLSIQASSRSGELARSLTTLLPLHCWSLRAAARPQARLVAAACASLLQDYMLRNPEVCYAVLRLADEAAVPCLRAAALLVALRHFTEACCSGNGHVLALPAHLLRELLEHDDLAVSSEMDAFHGLACWVEHAPARASCLADLLGAAHVRGCSRPVSLRISTAGAACEAQKARAEITVCCPSHVSKALACDLGKNAGLRCHAELPVQGEAAASVTKMSCFCRRRRAAGAPEPGGARGHRRSPARVVVRAGHAARGG